MDFSKESGFRTFVLKSPKLMTNASPLDLRKDLLRNCPVLVFFFGQRLAKEYLFGIFGYLTYIGYPVYWYGENLSDDEEQRRVLLASPDDKVNETVDVFMYTGLEGKKSLWKQLSPYVSKFENLPPYNPIVPEAKIILDKPASDCRILANLAGFLRKNKIPYSWNSIDSSDDCVFVGRKAGKFHNFIEVVGANDIEKKRNVLTSLMSQGYIKKNPDGSFSS